MGREEEAGSRSVRAPRDVRALTDPRNPALEAAIASDPFDREAYRVYADWLEEQGDIRAQLIRLHLAGKDGKPVSKLFAQHESYLLGPLARLADQLEWKHGFIHAARLTDQQVRAGDVALLLAHPSARFLVELDATSVKIEEAITALAQAPASLRALSLCRQGGWGLRPTAPIAHVLPQLDTLSLIGRLAFEQMPLPRLKSLTIERDQRAAIDITFPALTTLTLRGVSDIGTIDTPLLETATIEVEHAERAIAEARWPLLQRLTIANVDPNALAPLFARTDLRSLTSLGVNGAKDNVALCRLLRDAPFAKQLTRLQLTSGSLGDEAASVLAGGSFPALRELDAQNNVLTAAGYATLDEMKLGKLLSDRRYDDTGE